MTGLTVWCVGGCGTQITDETGWGRISGLDGFLCPTCFAALARKRGRLCNACVRAQRQRWPDPRTACTNQHRMRHSKVIGHCVDSAILPFLEGFNDHVTRTFASCQGEPSLPTMPPIPRWVQQPYIMVTERLGGDLQVALAWAAANRDRYQVGAVTQ